MFEYPTSVPGAKSGPCSAACLTTSRGGITYPRSPSSRYGAKNSRVVAGSCTPLVWLSS